MVAKIGDFGLAVEENTLNQGGTPGFAAPEIYQKTHLLAKSPRDLWGFGVTVLLIAFNQADDVGSFFSFKGSIPSYVECLNQAHLRLLVKDGMKKWSSTEIAPRDFFLKRIANACLQLDPDQRPSSESLLPSFRKKIEALRELKGLKLLFQSDL